ncbi:MAG: cytochrome b/b6 domain-containing protein [Armatimonadota bacterium]
MRKCQLLSVLLLFALLFLLVLPGRAQDDAEIIAPGDIDTCLGCHGEAVSQEQLAASPHGKTNCQACHAGVDRFPHPEKAVAKKPNCSGCHAAQKAGPTWATHHAAKGGTSADCSSCHGKNAHAVVKLSGQQASCKQCHGKAVSDIRNSMHRAANLTCADCHDKAASSRQADALCDRCHRDIEKVVNGSVHGAKGMSCLACHGKHGHRVSMPRWGTPAQQQAACTQCHADVEKKMQASVHNGSRGMKLNCVDCHGASPHDIQKPAQHAGEQADAQCSRCHSGEAWRLAPQAHGQAAKGGKSPLSCRTCHGGSAHSVTLKPAAAKGSSRSADCVKCHQQAAHAIAGSAHNGAIPVNGNRQLPDCVTCHGESMHKVAPAASLSAEVQDATCIKCHPGIAGEIKKSVHGAGNDKFRGKAPSCVACHGGSSHRILPLAEMDRKQQEEACKNCHSSLSKSLKNSVHDLADKEAGDHPTCLSCHGGNPHQIAPPKHTSPQALAMLCGECHSNKERMGRYGLGTDAFTSYAQSFHGRALLRFKKDNSANCTDCHGLHGVLAPDSPDSPTHPNHVVETCGKCHPKGKLNFAMSGANHLRTHIDKHPILHIEEMAFLVLIWGSMSFLLGMVALDLRVKVARKGAKPESGKLAAWLIAISFFALVGGILLAYLQVPYAWGAWILAAGCMAAAFVCYHMKKRRDPPHPVKKWYPRMSRIQRVQHLMLAGSFTILVLTGFPLRFAEVEWMHYPLYLFGGFDGARIIHRIAGVLMVINWVWHLGYLLYRWKQFNFSLKSWTMFPSWKDVTDLFDSLKYYVGLTDKPPQYTRFQFREKFDYFADMWGTIVMGFSGFILWFPAELGNHLPTWMFGFAYIAHSYEGLLAMMAIILWHFYNVHFNPDAFPMNPAWLTGNITEEEMERDHPLELKELQDAGAEAQPKQPAH